MTRPTDPPSPLLVAEGIGVRTRSGIVFEGLDLYAKPGSLTCLAGPGGTGRSSVLLALSGRMRLTTGRASVCGRQLPGEERAVRDVSALGCVRGVNELDPALSLDDHVRSEALLAGRRMGPAARVRALEAAGVSASGSDRVRDVCAADSIKTGIVLALVRKPALLFVDDVDDGVTGAEKDEIWTLLARIARSGVTVLATVSDSSAVPAHVPVVMLGRPAEAIALEVEHALT